jgi:hypothetical protein
MNSEVLNYESLQFQPPFLAMFYTCTFHNLDFNTRVEPYMFFTFLIVVLKYVKM